jgi:hypothetical protein
MSGVSRRARLVFVAAVTALVVAVLAGALFQGASADSTRELVRVTFRPSGVPGVSGWRADHGEAFDARRAFGWVRDDDSGTPVSMTQFAVSRSKTAGETDTFVAMQPPKQRWGRWVMAVPSGTYRITVTVGDASGDPASQSLRIENKTVVDRFVPSAKHPTKTVTADVWVRDGALTLDPLYPNRSTNTKLVSVIVAQVLGGNEAASELPVTTEPPATEPSTTEPPTTEPPVTEPPTTVPPTTTVPPVTTPPVDSGLRFQAGFAGGGLFLSGSDADIKRELDGMAATGATWLRIGFLWSALEPKAPGQYSWKHLDEVVGWANARGLRIVANVAYTPAWARPAGCGDMTCAPADPAAYGRFMRALVGHYAPMGVHHYEVWNEPNTSIFWKPRPNPAAYTTLLTKAYTQAHAADPTVTVIAGVFAPARDNEAGTTLNPRTFLTGMYQAGAAHRFDALAFHPYSANVDPRTVAYWNMMTGVGPDLVAIMNSHGDTGIKIWGTEMSYSTSIGPKAVTQTEQATLLRYAFDEWRTHDWAGPLFIFTYRDMGTNATNINENFGLVKRDFTPKLALASMRQYLTGRT